MFFAATEIATFNSSETCFFEASISASLTFSSSTTALSNFKLNSLSAVSPFCCTSSRIFLTLSSKSSAGKTGLLQILAQSEIVGLVIFFILFFLILKNHFFYRNHQDAFSTSFFQLIDDVPEFIFADDRV